MVAAHILSRSTLAQLLVEGLIEEFEFAGHIAHIDVVGGNDFDAVLKELEFREV